MKKTKLKTKTKATRKKAITMRMPKETISKIKLLARKNKISQAKLVERFVREA